MTTLENYNSAFTEAFEIEEDSLPGHEYQAIEAWDSVGHMMLISLLEEKLGIQMEMDDIIDLSSYEKGKELLLKYGIEFGGE